MPITRKSITRQERDRLAAARRLRWCASDRGLVMLSLRAAHAHLDFVRSGRNISRQPLAWARNDLLTARSYHNDAIRGGWYLP